MSAKVNHGRGVGALQWVRGPITAVMVNYTLPTYDQTLLQWVRGPITAVMPKGTRGAKRKKLLQWVRGPITAVMSRERLHHPERT